MCIRQRWQAQCMQDPDIPAGSTTPDLLGPQSDPLQQHAHKLLQLQAEERASSDLTAFAAADQQGVSGGWHVHESHLQVPVKGVAASADTHLVAAWSSAQPNVYIP